ncbi:MAG: potassium/proton antiporter [Rubricoccaceae bacterium]
MPTIDLVLLVGGLLLLLGIASSKLSTRVGMPVLVLFLGLGMLAGSDGPGGIAFGDFGLANALASAALALILFDGGLRTSWSSVAAAWKPALVLSTLGVLLTAGVTGLAAWALLELPLAQGLLLGAIVGSTDAAAVFSVLRTSGLRLPERLTATLEVESGSNDPMAIFLTLGLVGLITAPGAPVSGLLGLFVVQFGVGALVGVAGGLAASWTVNRINLDHAGLYPLLVAAAGLVTFGAAAVLGGSGFLAVYVAGVVLGNRRLVFRNGILFFHDATAWLGQIALFVMLGLLSFPSRLPGIVGPGLLIALVLIFVARPLAVWLCTRPFGFDRREVGLVAWAGLKGAVPITLATFPLMAGVEGSARIFDVVFFVVLLSAISQGWTLAGVARRLRLAQPSVSVPPVSVEFNALRHVDGEVVDYTVEPSARVAGQALRDVAIPEGVAVTLVVRDGTIVIPRGTTRLLPGDHVFVAMHAALRPFVSRLFDPYAETPPLRDGLTLTFAETYTVGQLHRFFGIPGPTWSEQPIADVRAREADPHLGPFRVLPADEPGFVRLVYDAVAEAAVAAPAAAPVSPPPPAAPAGTR